MGTDVHSPEVRSYNMSQIRNRNTKPELKLRSMLHRAGYRFRIHNDKLPGKPDIVLPKYKTAIFVHGCFWHRHEGCRYCTTPKTRKEFWENKLSGNVVRDRLKQAQLEEAGWRVIVVWECELKHSAQETVLRLDDQLREGSK